MLLAISKWIAVLTTGPKLEAPSRATGTVEPVNQEYSEVHMGKAHA